MPIILLSSHSHSLVPHKHKGAQFFFYQTIRRHVQRKSVLLRNTHFIYFEMVSHSRKVNKFIQHIGEHWNYNPRLKIQWFASLNKDMLLEIQNRLYNNRVLGKTLIVGWNTTLGCPEQGKGKKGINLQVSISGNT